MEGERRQSRSECQVIAYYTARHYNQAVPWLFYCSCITARRCIALDPLPDLRTVLGAEDMRHKAAAREAQLMGQRQEEMEAAKRVWSKVRRGLTGGEREAG